MIKPADVPAGSRGDEWRVVYGVLVLGAAGLLVWAVRPVLTPVVLYLVVLALLGPYAGRKGHALVVTVATVLMAIWLLDTLGGLMAPFILADQ